MIRTLFWLLDELLSLYIWAVILAAVFSMLASFGVLDTRNRDRLDDRRLPLSPDGAGAAPDPQLPAQLRQHRPQPADPAAVAAGGPHGALQRVRVPHPGHLATTALTAFWRARS